MKIKLLFISLFVCLFTSAQTIDVSSKGEPINHWWSVGAGAGRANEGLRASWLEQLKLAHDSCGFQYVRMHGLFNDDMFVCFEKPNGTIVYNWQYIDDLYDHMLALGVRPFVELSFFPKCIAAKNSMLDMWYRANVSVDSTSFTKWHNLIEAFAKHLIERYGIDEVSNWYFEVWNEPNLTGTGGFFHGTKSDYFRLYKESATALKAVSPRLRVGGPATSNFIADHRHDGEILDNRKSVFYSQDKINKQQWKGIWIEEFLKYCEKENLPVDFISTHAYPTDYALDPDTKRGRDAIRYVNSLHDDLTWLRETIKGSHYPNAEIHITEWSTSPNSRDIMHDLLPPAAYIMKVNLDCLGMANSLMYWTFTDIFEEKGGGETIFHGGFGMINFQGILKPTYHAYRMLNSLGDEKIFYKEPVFVSRSSKTGKIVAVAYNYPKEYFDNVPSAKNAGNYMQASSKGLDVTFTHLKPNAKFVIETLDNEHGNVYRGYEAMGKPRNPTRQQVETLKEVSRQTLKEMVSADAKGRLTVKRTLTPWACVLIKEL